ncbi:MAG: hypothetical protein U1F76_21440 [Candidatus Competibacteraceae bacterium]
MLFSAQGTAGGASIAGRWATAGLRRGVGMARGFVAPATRTPVVLQGLAVLSVAAARQRPCPGLGALPRDPGGVGPAAAGWHSGRVGGRGGLQSRYPGGGAGWPR